jgi:type III restriction enzyme
MAPRLSLSEHTLDIDVHKWDVEHFDFAEVEDYVSTLTGDREYQFHAIKNLMIYLWGGAYETIVDLARENYEKKLAIQQRFKSEDVFLRMLPLPDRLSGVCHMATGTGKSYVMFAVAHLSILLGKVARVMILGPPSTVIESGLREKFIEYLYSEKGAALKSKLPERMRHKVIRLLTCNDPIHDSSIVIENINAIYNRDRNAISDTLFNHSGEVLVLSDEVHHAYTHLKFSGEVVGYDFSEGKEGRGDTLDERLWMKFLREEPWIKRHIGFTGTPYNKNDYFPDVVYNYSIRDAIDEKIIKKINPILKTETDEGERDLTPQQRFEQILKTHAENRIKYAYPRKSGKPKVKPITIFIHPTQAAAERNADQFVQVLADDLRTREASRETIPRSILENMAREKVICVISRLGASEYQQKLDQIEETDPKKVGGKVEFVFAVNKLSEGWDVDNVFQIVPAEERVFDSKLLISQVLGRGLRLPREVSHRDILDNYPVVTITNHDRFARHIRELLDEVTECEMRLASNVFTDPEQKRFRHHFNLFNLEYLPSHRVVDRKAEELENGKGPYELKLTQSPEKLGVRVTYLQGIRRFELSKEFFTVDRIVLDIERRFKNTVFESKHFDFGDGLVLDDIPGRTEIEKIIQDAMNKADIEGDRLSRDNRQQIDLFFNQFLPKGKSKVIRENIEGAVTGIRTTKIQQSTARSGGLSHEISLFISEDFERELDEQNLFILKELKKEAQQLTLEQIGLFPQEDFNRDYIRRLLPDKNLFAVNTSLFRTPQNLVIVSYEPERLFVYRLIENSRLISEWVKSPDRDFYSLNYEYWKGGKDRTRRSFNPDFFIRIDISDYLIQIESNASASSLKRIKALQDKGIDELVLVVEIKSDEDESESTRAKGQYAIEHFKALNRRLKETNPIDIAPEYRESMNQVYAFYLLRPSDYAGWFASLRNGLIAADPQISQIFLETSEQDAGTPIETSQPIHLYKEVMFRINEDWGSDSLAEKLVIQIMKDQMLRNVQVLSIDSLLERCGELGTIQEIEDTIVYLSSPRSGLFRIGFEFNDKQGSKPLSVHEVYTFLQSEYMSDSKVGEKIDNYRAKVSMVFYKTQKFAALEGAYDEISKGTLFH